MKRSSVSICSFASMMSAGLSITVIGPAVSALEKSLGATPGEIGLLITAQSVGFIAAVLAAGYIADRHSLKLVSGLGQLTLSLGLGGFALSTNLTAGMAAYSMLGLATGLIQIAVNTSISRLYPENRASALNILHIFFGIGALAGPLLSGSIIQAGCHWGFIYGGLSILSAAVFFSIILTGYPRPEPHTETSILSLLKILKDSYILLLCLTAVIYVGIEMAINSWSVLYAEKGLGLDKIFASSILSYFWFFMTFGRIICIYLTRRMRADLLLVFLSAGAGLSFTGFYLATSGALAGVSLSLTGLFFSGIFPILMGLGGNAFPDRLGSVNSILLTCLGLGLMFFPWLTGVIGEHYSLGRGMLFLCSAVAALFVSTLLVACRNRRD